MINYAGRREKLIPRLSLGGEKSVAFGGLMSRPNCDRPSEESLGYWQGSGEVARSLSGAGVG